MACQERTVSCPKHGIHRWEELGLDPDEPYFNSGGMVVDLERWRALNVGPRVLEYLQKYRNTLNVRGNQEGFNAVLAGLWTPMPAGGTSFTITISPNYLSALEPPF